MDRCSISSRPWARDFLDGIDRLATLAAMQRTAMMCAEEDPSRCHRRLLVAPAMLERGLEIVHIRGDGRVEREVVLTEAGESRLMHHGLRHHRIETERAEAGCGRCHPGGKSPTL